MSSTYYADMRDYYQQVLQEESPPDEHPYATNLSWHRKVAVLRRWISECTLAEGRVLEIGSGLGVLQDMVPNYVGIDLAANSANHMHKPFCACSATSLPFADNTFDGVWSFWVLEHIPHPDAMLAEMRRVVKPGGSVFLVAAYAVDTWVSQGIHKRPWRDLSARQKLTKLSIPLRSSLPYKAAATILPRFVDLARYLARPEPTRVRYRSLDPNFAVYWDYDADACSAIDAYSVALYFLSRGDQPYRSAGVLRSLLQRSQPQVYIIRK